MNKLCVSLILILLLLITATFSFAASDDFSYGIGLKSWYNHFYISATDSKTGRTAPGAGNSTALMMGPSAKFSYKNFFMGGSYLTTVTDYKNMDGNDTGIVVNNMSRHDIDAIAGYMIIPQLGVFGGYKGIFMDKNITSEFEKVYGSTPDVKYSAHGAALGLTSNYPIPLDILRMALYGNVAYVRMNQRSTYDDGRPHRIDNFNGISAELGLAYNIFAGLNAQIGYKIQNLTSVKNSDNGNTVSENFNGVTFGVDYRF
jgi:hypothetical protein